MHSAEIKIDYSNLDKPFELIERYHDLGGTSYFHICRLTEEQARLLNKEGISWLYGVPNWEEHWKKLDIYKAEKEAKEANKKLENLINAQ